MATNLGVKLAKIGDTPFFLGLTFHNGWEDDKAGGCVNTADILSTLHKNLVNFGLWSTNPGVCGDHLATI